MTDATFKTFKDTRDAFENASWAWVYAREGGAKEQKKFEEMKRILQFVIEHYKTNHEALRWVVSSAKNHADLADIGVEASKILKKAKN
jgi:hypothetical protein